MTHCFLRDRGPCFGRLDPHHLVSQQRIKREFPRGAWRTADGQLVKATRACTVPFGNVARMTLGMVLADERNLIPLCRQHHDQLHAKRIRIARADLPEVVEGFARELGMAWSLDRDYPERTAA